MSAHDPASPRLTISTAPVDANAPVAMSRPSAPIATQGLGGSARGGVSLWLPLPFLVTGVVGAALFGVLLPFVAPQALLAPDFPHVLALVHIATLGWLTMTIMGASLQLVPVIVVSPLRAARMWPAQYPVYLLGVVLMVTGFWFTRPPILIAGGIFVVCAALHYAIIMFATLMGATTRPLSVRFLMASVGYFCAIVTLGLTAALNFQFGFLGAATDRLVLAHITLGVIGWLTTTLMGVSYTLMPMFALVHGQSDAPGRRVFILLNAGVLGLATGFAFSSAAVELAAGLFLLSAVAVFAWDYAHMLRSRKRRLLDVTQRHGIAGICYLAVLAVATPILALTGAWRHEQVAVALALAAFVGWLGQSAIGYLYKIIPFLIWQTRYGPLVGKRPVPLMRDLISQRAATISLWLINVALPVVILGAAMNWIVLLQIGATALAAGLALAAGNIVRSVVPRQQVATHGA